MSENFRGVTFAEQAVTPADDAIVRRAIFPDGTLAGAEISYSGSTLTMAAGFIIACGRVFQHTAAQNWAVVDATSGFARLVLTVDLTRTATESTFDQIDTDIEYATSKDGFVALDQQDINLSGTRYQIEAAVVSLGTGGITGIVSRLEKAEVGAGLNFKVVGGTTRPANPSENTIWVNMGTELTGYVFSATEPASPTNGMVWIRIGTSSPVEFNALKKNSIQLYPLSVKRYNNGWADKEAEIYQSGGWKSATTEILIYENGTTHRELTAISGTTFEDEYIYFSVAANTAARVRTAQKYDLSAMNTVEAAFINKTSAAEISVKIVDESDSVITRANSTGSEAGTVSCDVSAVNGEYYIEVQLYYYSGKSSAGVTKIIAKN